MIFLSTETQKTPKLMMCMSKSIKSGLIKYKLHLRQGLKKNGKWNQKIKVKTIQQTGMNYVKHLQIKKNIEN